MDELFFTKTHEWTKREDDTVLVGITDYAQKELGDVVFVEFSKKGEKFRQFSRFGTIESTKAAFEIYLPLSGKIIETNKALNKNPELINQSSLGRFLLSLWVIFKHQAKKEKPAQPTRLS